MALGFKFHMGSDKMKKRLDKIRHAIAHHLDETE